MRLLQTSNLELVTKYESLDQRFPPYAILSHTWGADDEEVSLQHLQTVLAARKNQSDDPVTQSIMARPGFIKIQNAAKLALSEGYDFIWIDTCCIDKTSSAELSEAITSMFHWYEQSDVCYVFLSDVEAVRDDKGQLQPETWEEISKSRWFTRGWTLQELIAPSKVRFYCKNWVFLVAKNGYFEKPSLSDITGIDMFALMGARELESYGIATRMKWASQRKTTRIEDLAYCLMGIFNINMPLMYGEGAKAFIRLQQEILQGSNDQSLFAWRCPEEDPLSHGISGLLARSSAWFQHSGQFQHNVGTSTSAPSTITNVGLHVQFCLSRNNAFGSNKVDTTPDGCTIAVLGCRPYIDENPQAKTFRKAGLMLQHLGGDQYCRVECSSIIHIDPEVLQADGSKYEYIYVGQNPTMHPPHIYIDDRMLKHELLSEWSPSGYWNATTKTLTCKNPRHKGIVGVFRYSLCRPGTTGSLFDVMVGFQSKRKRANSSGLWCFVETASPGERLETRSPPVVAGLPGVHQHPDGIRATIEFERKDHMHNEFTLKLTQFKPFLLPMGDGHCYLVPEVKKPPSSERNSSHLSLWLSVRTQPDLFTEREFQEEFIRTRSSPHEWDSAGALLTKPKTTSEVLKSFQPEMMEGENAMPKTMRVLLKACLDCNLQRLEDPRLGGVGGLIDLPLCIYLFPLTSRFRLIHWVIVGGSRSVVGALINHDSLARRDRNADWLPALHVATIMGDELMIREVMKDRGASRAIKSSSSCSDVNKPHDSLMHLAAAHVHTASIEQVFCIFKDGLEDDVKQAPNWVNHDRNDLDETPLHRAAAMDNTHAIRAIFALSADDLDIECLDHRRRSPLWHAAAAGACDSALLLIRRGANVNTRDELGSTALHAACRSAFSEIVQVLLSHGADPHACTIIETGRNVTCMTTITYAALRGNPATLCALLAAGSKVHVPDELGGSDLLPVHIAAANGYLAFIRILHGRLEIPQDFLALTPYVVHTRLERGLPGVDSQVREEAQGASALKLAIATHEPEVALFLRGLGELHS